MSVTDRSAIRALDRLQAQAPKAIKRGLLRIGLKVGALIATRAPKKSGRLIRSFLVPFVEGDAVFLGNSVPIYGAIHEYGGTIKPVHGDYLVFQIGDAWIATKQVKIKEKRYARDSVDQAEPLAPMILAKEIEREFRA